MEQGYGFTTDEQVEDLGVRASWSWKALGVFQMSPPSADGGNIGIATLQPRVEP